MSKQNKQNQNFQSQKNQNDSQNKSQNRPQNVKQEIPDYGAKGKNLKPEMRREQDEQF